MLDRLPRQVPGARQPDPDDTGPLAAKPAAPDPPVRALHALTRRAAVAAMQRA